MYIFFYFHIHLASKLFLRSRWAHNCAVVFVVFLLQVVWVLGYSLLCSSQKDGSSDAFAHNSSHYHGNLLMAGCPISTNGARNFFCAHQQFCTCHHVLLLLTCCYGPRVPEIYLVEEALDHHPNDSIRRHLHPFNPVIFQRLRLPPYHCVYPLHERRLIHGPLFQFLHPGICKHIQNL